MTTGHSKDRSPHSKHQRLTTHLGAFVSGCRLSSLAPRCPSPLPTTSPLLPPQGWRRKQLLSRRSGSNCQTIGARGPKKWKFPRKCYARRSKRHQKENCLLERDFTVFRGETVASAMMTQWWERPCLEVSLLRSLALCLNFDLTPGP